MSVYDPIARIIFAAAILGVWAYCMLAGKPKT
jgi:hypothetical protein